MNILSQIIPGLREARTPFAVGLLWVLAGGVAATLLPETVWQEEIFKDGAAILGKAPVEIIVSISAFVIYLAGILLETLGRLIGRLIAAVAGLIFALSIIFCLLYFLESLIAAVLIIAGILLLWTFLRYKRIESRSFRLTLEDTLMLFFLKLGELTDSWRTDFQRLMESDIEVFNDLSKEELELFYSRKGNESFLRNVVEALDRDVLYQAAVQVELSLGEVYKISFPQHQMEIAKIKNVTDLRISRREDSTGDNAVRSALADKLERERMARERFSEGLLNLAPSRALLRRKLDRAEVKLRTSQPESYAEYDRIRAEGEFRKGVAWPLLGLIMVVTYKWHLVFNSKNDLTAFWLVSAGGVLVSLLMTAAGENQRKNARRMLYDYVRERVIVLDGEEQFGAGEIVFKKPVKVDRSSFVKYLYRKAMRSAGESIGRRIAPQWWDARQKLHRTQSVDDATFRATGSQTSDGLSAREGLPVGPDVGGSPE